MKRWFVLLLLLLTLPALVLAQGPRTLVLQTAATTGNGAVLNTPGYSVVGVAVSGVAAGADRVVTFKVSLDTVSFTNVQCRNLADGTLATSVTLSGTTLTQWSCPCPGMQAFQTPVSGGTTGAANVTASALPQVSWLPPVVGSGTGTVTSIATTGPLGGGTITTTGTLTCTTCGVTTGKLSQFAATTSAELAGVLSDETGTGKVVLHTAPEFSGGIGINTGGAPTVALDIRNPVPVIQIIPTTAASSTIDFYNSGFSKRAHISYDASADALTFYSDAAAGGLSFLSLAGNVFFYTATSGQSVDFWTNNLSRMTVGGDGSVTIVDLKTRAAGAGKKVVCVDTASGVLSTSATALDCS